MHDSMEDYIKIAGVGKSKQTVVVNEKLANIKQTVELKKQSEEYAQGIVEFLIEGKLRPQIFLRSLNSINETLYEDVVDERAISKLCGYPICGMSIPDMPEKRFIILAKINKVFDLTDRKKYCSNFCYKASIHIKKQIDNSPLWLRTSVNSHQYNLLAKTNSGLAPGEELINGVQLPAEESPFTPVSAFTEAGLVEAESKCIKVDVNEGEGTQLGKSILKHAEPKPCSSKNAGFQNNTKKGVEFMDNSVPGETCRNKSKEQEELNQSIEIVCRSLSIKLDLNTPSNEKIKPFERPKYVQRITDITKHKESPSADIQQMIEKVKYMELNKNEKVKTAQDDKMKSIMEKIQNKNANKAKGVIIIDTVENPEAPKAHREENVQSSATLYKCLDNNECAEIISAFRKWLTLDTFVYLFGEDVVKQKVQLDAHFCTLKVAELETAQKLKYLDICKRLQLKELEEEKFDNDCLCDDSGILKPLPDYTMLKEEADAMNVKAQAFYSGKILAKTKKTAEHREIVLPMMDVSNTTALRRGVFNKSISPYILNHVTELSLPETTTSKIQDMINTFKFDAKNVVFKPAQWNVIALLLINCLGKLDTHLLASAEAIEYLSTSMKKLANSNEMIQETNFILKNFDSLISDQILENN